MKYLKLTNRKVTDSINISPYFTYQEAISFIDTLLVKLPVDIINKNIKFDEITKEEYNKGVNIYNYLYKGDS